MSDSGFANREYQQRIAHAYAAWLAGDGRTCANGSTLGIQAQNEQYLHNRLWHAFMAGVKAAEDAGKGTEP